jgi:hypothetical protein
MSPAGDGSGPGEVLLVENLGPGVEYQEAVIVEGVAVQHVLRHGRPNDPPPIITTSNGRAPGLPLVLAKASSSPLQT